MKYIIKISHMIMELVKKDSTQYLTKLLKLVPKLQ